MGTSQIGGTHWLAVSNKHKAYFDPLGLPRPRVIPKYYSYLDMDLTNLDYKVIGDYDTNDGFFVKVFGQGEAFWCRFISSDPHRNAFILRVYQLLCREHPFKYG
ncbi:uncharacterized protein PITG_04817 [Phytophthora infestans T30-4]|uniref:Uncharacterized protein n=1 Tax=Phytophthora infestans (strain T30-4) TaxID=403677 RepID=D0N235_PHYIT|nr:uncharacterized protein PITG_04817 [Phytophthora infestans T30-4]EEY68364.1 hypothetical protein PITG_04817 [Phytophthora infestans T30-4]|eukprot:XP_002905523.1 hypothetical protein PITG_04817 [Phytophthora infestans T30-4]